MKIKREDGFSLVEVIVDVLIILAIVFGISKIVGLFSNNEEDVNNNEVIQSEEIVEIEGESEPEL